MGRGRAANYNDQRDLILGKAAHLFAKRGYASTSMIQVAEACGLSKATLYHYYRDKYSLLVSITEGHVSRLQALVQEANAQAPAPELRLRELIRRFVEEYADAQDAHRVLTEDVKFLEEADRQRVLDKERDVVASFASTVAGIRPELAGVELEKPLTMLLFGMINWMFTWMKPRPGLGYDDLAPIVADLFLGGLPAVRLPSPQAHPNKPQTALTPSA